MTGGAPPSGGQAGTGAQPADTGAGASPVGTAPARSGAVGMVGLGVMGGAMARHLLAAGCPVHGFDVAEEALEAFAGLGGVVVSSAVDVVASAEVTLWSLPTVAAFEAVTAEVADQGTDRWGGPRIVVETSTLPLAVKESGRLRLQEHGVELLDCPISGTGAQMAVGDVAFYLSGETAAVERAREVVAMCSRAQFVLGAFGNGTKLKLVANHLVAVHNASAAEALVLAERGGLDPAVALPALVAGAGTSRMLELRGPMMVRRSYDEATMRVRTFQKDVDIITGFARQAGCPLPVFAAAAQLNLAALSAGFAECDTAAVHAVVDRLAGG